VQRFGETIGLRPEAVTIYGPFESDFLIRETARDIGFIKGKSWRIPKKIIEKLFSDYYDLWCIDPPETDPAKPLFDAFNQRTGENNSLCYDQLLIALEDLIPTLAKHLHIRHVLVDECQDYTKRQWQIVNKMVDAFGASLFAVGDGDQSIFSFRNAVPEYLIDHQHEFDLFKLETNYRSCRDIVEASNRLIRHNTQRIDKTMRAAREDFGKVEFIYDCTSATVANAMAERFNINPYAEIAILSRVHALLKKLSDELTTRGIPHTYVGRKSALTNSEEFRRLHAFLKLIVNPFDNFSLMLIKDLIGLSDQDYAEIRVRAARKGLSHFQAWQECFVDPTDPYSRFFDHEWSLKEAVILAARLWGCNDEISSFIADWLTQNPTGTIKQYLDWLATYDISDEIADEQDGLMLMTVHCSKGTEYNTVIIIGANEGIFPSKQALASNELEEERRLFFVAATRAKDSLIVTIRPESKEIDGKVYQSLSSRFVKEMME
jgi:superfamily I DNA/RNA helicase